AVPLGSRPDPVNLHGFVNTTGGKVVRLLDPKKIDATVAGLLEAVAAPVLYPTALKLPGEFADVLPTRVPQLRRDAPTLIVGKIQPKAKLEYTVAGTVAGKETKTTTTLDVPEPDVENFFLVSVYNQWKERKESPALAQADRLLSAAFMQNQLARADLLSKA